MRILYKTDLTTETSALLKFRKSFYTATFYSHFFSILKYTTLTNLNTCLLPEFINSALREAGDVFFSETFTATLVVLRLFTAGC
jgi:hypothetical protein